MALRENAKDAMLKWMPIDDTLGAVKFRNACKLNSRRFDTSNLFIVSECTLSDYSPDVTKGTFYQELYSQRRVITWVEQDARMYEWVDCPQGRRI